MYQREREKHHTLSSDEKRRAGGRAAPHGQSCRCAGGRCKGAWPLGACGCWGWGIGLGFEGGCDILYHLYWAGLLGQFWARIRDLICGPGEKKPTGLRVRVQCSQTHTRKPDGSNFLPISRPTGRESDLDPHPNGVKIHRVSSFGYPLPTLLARLPNTCNSHGTREKLKRESDHTQRGRGGEVGWPGASSEPSK